MCCNSYTFHLILDVNTLKLSWHVKHILVVSFQVCCGVQGQNDNCVNVQTFMHLTVTPPKIQLFFILVHLLSFFNLLNYFILYSCVFFILQMALKEKAPYNFASILFY